MHSHVDDPLRDCLILTYRLAKTTMSASVLDSLIQLTPHRAQGTCQDEAPLPFDSGIEDGHSCPRPTEQSCSWNAAVGEGNLAHWGGAQAKLFEGLTDCQTWCISLYDE